MTAQIKLKKITDIYVHNNKVVADSIVAAGQEIKLKEGINSLSVGQKVDFAGQDYKGTFKLTNANGTGTLDLFPERSENHFEFKDVKLNKTGNHTFTGTGKNGEATILLATSTPKIIEKDSGWFTTELTGTASSLKFGEWNDYDIPGQSYLDINFS